MFKMYQIVIEALSTKKNLLNVSKPLEEDDLVQIVRKEIEALNYENNPNVQRAREWRQDINRLPQRRIYVTTTLVRVVPMVLEQSMQILRLQRNKLEYFVRANILGEHFDQPWFNDAKSINLLEDFVEPAITRINFCGIKLEYLVHSASQIKQKSFWLYVSNYPSLSRDNLLNSLGEFNERKPMKKLAR